MKKIIENITQEINNELPTNSKIFLYSAHEYNVAFILAAMNVLKPLIPSPGSMVIIELHKIEEEHFVKVIQKILTNAFLNFVYMIFFSYFTTSLRS